MDKACGLFYNDLDGSRRYKARLTDRTRRTKPNSWTCGFLLDLKHISRFLWVDVKQKHKLLVVWASRHSSLVAKSKRYFRTSSCSSRTWSRSWRSCERVIAFAWSLSYRTVWIRRRGDCVGLWNELGMSTSSDGVMFSFVVQIHSPTLDRANRVFRGSLWERSRWHSLMPLLLILLRIGVCSENIVPQEMTTGYHFSF